MTWEQATFYLSAVVLVMQAVNLYTTAKVKLWAVEKFVTKGDFLSTLDMWSKTSNCLNFKRKEHG